MMFITPPRPLPLYSVYYYFKMGIFLIYFYHIFVQYSWAMQGEISSEYQPLARERSIRRRSDRSWLAPSTGEGRGQRSRAMAENYHCIFFWQMIEIFFTSIPMSLPQLLVINNTALENYLCSIIFCPKIKVWFAFSCILFYQYSYDIKSVISLAFVANIIMCIYSYYRAPWADIEIQCMLSCSQPYVAHLSILLILS